DLWLRRADAPYRDRVPRIDSRPDGDYRVIPGLPEWRVSGGEGAMADTKLAGETITKERVYRYAEQRPGASDPVARLADQDLDNIAAEVVYPGWLFAFGIPDLDVRAATMRIYNDWLADFCRGAPGRLFGAAELPVALDRLEVAIAEARRAKDLGLA